MSERTKGYWENEPGLRELRREREPHWKEIEREKLLGPRVNLRPMPETELAARVMGYGRWRIRSNESR